MRTLFSMILLFALAIPAQVEADEEDKGAKRPARPGPAKRPVKYGIEKLQKQLDTLRAKLEKLSKEADKDERERVIDEYDGYGVDDFKKKKRVRAKDLLGFVFEDPDAPFVEVRRKAVAVLIKKNDLYMDPDLSSERKGSRPSPRAALSKSFVNELKSKDARGRTMANTLLIGLWGKTTLAGPAKYNPVAKHKATWSAAIKDWNKYLRRR